jgi:ABC-2 type transport system ATP-binding protein
MIVVQNLKKNFGPKVAVNGISFSVEKGEVLGFLGPNGAGKSTTMRMITGFIPPTGGGVSVGGFDVQQSPIAAKRLIGYLPENAPSYSDMTVLGFLGFAAELRGFHGDAKRKAVRRAVEKCFLEPVIHQSIETLSKGYKHRTCLAQAILHDPEVLIMDEPTDGLDPNQKHEVRTLIRNMGEKKAIIFSTHILEEVEAVCSRAIIIDRGRVVANGTPAELKRRSSKAGTVTLRLAQNASLTASAVQAKLGGLSSVQKTSVTSESPVTVCVTPAPNEAPNGSLAGSIHELAAREAWKVEDLHTEEGQLDEVFRNITLGDKTTQAREEPQ